jgi:hypothetical protein
MRMPFLQAGKLMIFSAALTSLCRELRMSKSFDTPATSISLLCELGSSLQAKTESRGAGHGDSGWCSGKSCLSGEKSFLPDLNAGASCWMQNGRHFVLFVFLSLFSGYNSHPSQRIWQLSAAINTADVGEPSAVAMWPCGMRMYAVEQVRQNPFQPAHIFLLRQREVSKNTTARSTRTKCN